MELREVPATEVNPFSCLVKGEVLLTDGEFVHTIGFKDGTPVVQFIPPTKKEDKMTDKGIDLTKVKKVIVRIDPKTGKKYIEKDGIKIELRPQVPPQTINLKFEGQQEESKSVIIKAPFSLLNGQLPRLVPMTMPKLVPTSTAIRNMKILEKFQLVVNKKGGPRRALDKDAQTEEVERAEVGTQTEADSQFSLVNFILDSEECEPPQKNLIDVSSLRSKEDMHKFSFFNDMRNALVFDRSGNLPIHDSVMQNDFKMVQKNCVVLKAIRENVNILNQHNFASLHLAIIHNVDIEIIKVLLHHEADVSVGDPEGNTPLHLAIEHQRFPVLKLLVNSAVENKINLDIFNYEGLTPLIMACMNHFYEAAFLLLNHGADPNIKDMKSGRTALFHAAEAHDVDIVELLIQYKADTKIRNFFGTSPHDAMFELEEMPVKIRYCILGREHQKFQAKKKIDGKSESNAKKPKLETTPILRKVTCNDLMPRRLRK